MIYFDQAASSFPKPPEVGEAMIYALNEVGANPGRGSHLLARQAELIIRETRERAARIFGCSNPRKAVFFNNATAALNQAIKGMNWNEGDHIISTSFEHNSIRRPLENIKNTYNVDVSYIEWKDKNEEFLDGVEKSIKPSTRLIAMTHASNVTGSLIPVKEVSAIAKQNNVLVLVDASQTAGHIPINMKELGIDMMAFPGHKGLLGPQGTGMLLVEGAIDLSPIQHGGTGTFSENPSQPSQWPEKLESGTLNTPGIAGLNAALSVYETRENENVPRETILTKKLLKELKNINGVTCYGPDECVDRMPIVAFNVLEIPSQEIAMILDSHYQIAVRSGIHCSPLTHETMYTIEQGVVRASLSMYNTEKEIDSFVQAIKEIVESYNMI
ncbi:aminotransferase class V-fold PLP-dependent enzyme [Virgibacillus doumboii]|uniref:aminotransferase class V-fold PLP-dependent enzyme n=1 Tax=Virgibacillus doumboii TaxID=2697503 RepID=UPI0013E024DE|nr:aminotransferase class V-fold PLP-dependent enzyme [Virgibacillus doumboii]